MSFHWKIAEADPEADKLVDLRRRTLVIDGEECAEVQPVRQYLVDAVVLATPDELRVERQFSDDKKTTQRGLIRTAMTWAEEETGCASPGTRVHVVEGGALERLGPARPSHPVDHLRGRLAELRRVVGPFSFDRGPFVAGGSIARALLGDAGHAAADLDLFLREGDRDRVGAALASAGFKWEEDEKGSEEGPGTWWSEETGRVDVVVTDADAATTIARFDLRCAALATDGENLLVLPGALQDLADRKLFPLRRGKSHRIRRYLEMGLDPHPDAPELDVDVFLVGTPDIQHGIDGWTLPKLHTREDAFGLALLSRSVEVVPG